MADQKFSDFPLVVNPVLADITVVGLDALGNNAQFTGDEFGGGGGGTVTSVAGTAPIVIGGTPNLTPLVTITDATTIASGAMSAADKSKLDTAIPVGGTTNQVLAKTSATNYATAWVNQSSGSSTVLQYLFSTNNSTNPPSGKMTFQNNALATATNIVYFNVTTNGGTDITAVFTQWQAGDTL